MLRVPFIVATMLLLPSIASAQEFEDDDDFLFDGEEETEPAPPTERLEGADELGETEEEEEPLEDFTDPLDEEGEPVDLLGDEAAPNVLTTGDSAEIYRQRQAEYAELEIDEEVGAWEAYLAEYPFTPFAERIQQRIDTLMDGLYGERIVRDGPAVDAMHREIGFTQGLLIENIDPRSRLRAGFEMGLPDWFNPFIDYEHAFVRNFSAHIGLRRRYTGTSIEPGVKYAIIKSTRTNTIVTLLGDFRLNAAPTAFVALRPMLGVGKRFGEKLDVQIQAGADLELRQLLGVRMLGGLNLSYRASDTVGMFVESGYSLKDIGGQTGVGYFNVATFGMKFFPSKKGTGVNENIQVDMGATVPYSTNYYSFHYGSIMGQANYFLD